MSKQNLILEGLNARKQIQAINEGAPSSIADIKKRYKFEDWEVKVKGKTIWLDSVMTKNKKDGPKVLNDLKSLADNQTFTLMWKSSETRTDSLFSNHGFKRKDNNYLERKPKAPSDKWDWDYNAGEEKEERDPND